MKITPQHSYVLVEIINQKSITPAGIHIPDTMKNAMRQVFGRVKALGNGYFYQGEWHPIPLKVGDIVMMSGAAPSVPIEFSKVFTSGQGGALPESLLIEYGHILAVCDIPDSELATMFDTNKIETEPLRFTGIAS